MEPFSLLLTVKAVAALLGGIVALTTGILMWRRATRAGRTEVQRDVAAGQLKVSAEEIRKMRELVAESARIRAGADAMRRRLDAPGSVFGDPPGDGPAERPDPVRGGADPGRGPRPHSER